MADEKLDDENTRSDDRPIERRAADADGSYVWTELVARQLLDAAQIVKRALD